MSGLTKNKSHVSRSEMYQLLALIAFGFTILGFCIAIDRPEWFRIRPATGTALAMSNAAVPAQAAENTSVEAADAGLTTDP